MSKDRTMNIPESLARRPVDPKRGLPIPLVSEYEGEDGSTLVDFTAVNGETALKVAAERRCGLCGEDLDYWVVFLGGPRSAASRMYVDPPMHPDCAEAALILCPHIANPKLARAAKHKAGDVITPDGFQDEKPQTWILYLTRSYESHVHKGAPLFVAAPAKQLRRFEYDEDGALREVQP
jgi:hypothetical protein